MDNISCIRALRNKLRPITTEEDADAAVSMLLRVVDHDLKTLLVKRIETAGDPWSGQMALPGGKRDPKDLNLTQTAIRETLEETSIDLTHRCRFLGALQIMRSEQRPEMKILPLIIFLEHNPQIHLNDELELAIWISIDDLVKSRKTTTLDNREIQVFDVGEGYIWGLTYRVLTDFLKILGEPIP